MNNILASFIIFALAGLSCAKSVNHEESRIFHGTKVTTNERPYQAVALVDKNEGTPQRSGLCSVVLIKENWILTTTLCLLKPGSEIYFGTNKWCGGSGSTYTFQYDAGYTMGTVKKTIHRPRNGQPSFVLAELNQNVGLTSNIQLANLATELPQVGEEFEVAGWGQVADGSSASCDLLKVSLPRMNDEDCKRVLPDQKINDRVFCAGYLGEDKPSACTLDEGSPLVKDGKVYALALTFKRFCGEKDTPSVYLSVQPFTSWINKTIKNKN